MLAPGTSLHALDLFSALRVGQDVPPRIVPAGRSANYLERVNGKWPVKLGDVAPRD